MSDFYKGDLTNVTHNCIIIRSFYDTILQIKRK
ncbi:hypothetical protein EZS27_027074, partial [termite gut metagenome]